VICGVSDSYAYSLGRCQFLHDSRLRFDPPRRDLRNASAGRCETSGSVPTSHPGPVSDPAPGSSPGAT